MERNMRYEKFNDTEINEIRKSNPGIKVIAHPECPPEVINAILQDLQAA